MESNRKIIILIIFICLTSVGKVVSSILFVLDVYSNNFYQHIDHWIEYSEEIDPKLFYIRNARWEEVASMILMFICGLLYSSVAIKKIKKKKKK